MVIYVEQLVQMNGMFFPSYSKPSEALPLLIVFVLGQQGVLGALQVGLPSWLRGVLRALPGGLCKSLLW